MSKHAHHKPRHFDFAETRAAENRKMARRMTRAACWRNRDALCASAAMRGNMEP